MPEGDTIFKAAASLRKWLLGREVTNAKAKDPAVKIGRIVGTTIEEIEPKAKHLLIRFSNGLSLHTHMRMTGSWHLYGVNDKWQKPAWQAVVTLQCGDRLAVCFSAPVVELLSTKEEEVHVSLTGLGPDVLNGQPFDFEEVIRRAKLKSDCTIGELLLNQTVVSGIGNIYRCESLFLCKTSPTKLTNSLTEAQIKTIVQKAIALMRQSVEGARHQPWVYKRNNRPCRNCGTLIKRGLLGQPPRAVFWCPNCQREK